MTPKLAFHEPAARCSKSILYSPAERTAVYVHITALSQEKRKGDIWEQYFAQILGCFTFYFNEQSNKGIVVQIKNVKYDFELT